MDSSNYGFQSRRDPESFQPTVLPMYNQPAHPVHTAPHPVHDAVPPSDHSHGQIRQQQQVEGGAESEHTDEKVHNSDGNERGSVIDEEVGPRKDPVGLDEFERGKIEMTLEQWRALKAVLAAGTLALILAWWICGIVFKDTRRSSRIIPSTIWGWFFILLIVSRYIPITPLGRPIGKVWNATISRPFFTIPYWGRLAIGVAAVIGLVLGSAFGFKLQPGTKWSDRGRSIFGLILFQACLAVSSKDIRAVQWDTVIVGLIMQQILAMLVFKTEAIFDVVLWLSTLAQDFLNQAQAGAAFFWGDDLANQHLFIVSTLAAIIFFISFVQLLYYYGIMQWILKKFAWFFFHTMRVSGAEAVIAASSPFIGQGESACLVRPYVAHMTPSELHVAMTSGFSTIAGSVFAAYVNLGMPATDLLTSSVMSIPASISISKLRYPEKGEPLTRGQVVIARDDDDATSGLHAFSNGAYFGLRIAALIFCNVLTILSLLSMVDGLLTWIGKNFTIHHLTLELIMGYVFYPIAWCIGAPTGELLPIARLMGIRLISNEFVAFTRLAAMQDQLTPRAFRMAVYSLCGFANISSLGIQIGVLTGLAENQKAVLARVGPSALICGYLSTLQTAAIAGMLL